MPKYSWQNVNLVNLLKNAFNKKDVRIETDVNTSAIGEFVYGKHHVKNSLAYITLGTGIGVGLIINNKVVHGFMHPEGGHVFINKFQSDSLK